MNNDFSGASLDELDGPAIAMAMSALMLHPQNASQLRWLQRLTALGTSRPDEQKPAPNRDAVVKIIEEFACSEEGKAHQIDPFAEVFVQSISFYGGSYLVSPGSVKNSVQDLENLLEALFRDDWLLDEQKTALTKLIRALLIVSDIVLRKAGFNRGFSKLDDIGYEITVPEQVTLQHLMVATFVKNDSFNKTWLWVIEVLESLSFNARESKNSFDNDPPIDVNLFRKPFLRCDDGYRILLPVDIVTVIRFQILSWADSENLLAEVEKRLRFAIVRRSLMAINKEYSINSLRLTQFSNSCLVEMDPHRDCHFIFTSAIDDVKDGEIRSVDKVEKIFTNINEMIQEEEKKASSVSKDVLYVIVADEFCDKLQKYFTKLVKNSLVLILHSYELELIHWCENENLIGIFLFAQAVRNISDRIIASNFLDIYYYYLANDKSFYISDDVVSPLLVIDEGTGVPLREKYVTEVDRHGVLLPSSPPCIVPVRRRYRKDAPEIYVHDKFSSSIGYVVEFEHLKFHVTISDKSNFVEIIYSLLECVSFWIRECVLSTPIKTSRRFLKITISIDIDSRDIEGRGFYILSSPVKVKSESNEYEVTFSSTFLQLLHQELNLAERELVLAILIDILKTSIDDAVEILEQIAPKGKKRMVVVFDPECIPDLLVTSLPEALTCHRQVEAQLLDDLGYWMGCPSGGNLKRGVVAKEDRTKVLNKAVEYLFKIFELEISQYVGEDLLDFLIIQNESLVNDEYCMRKRLPFRLACFGNGSITSENIEQKMQLSVSTQMANRFLIEYVAACPPKGCREITTLDYFRLLAISDEIIQIGISSDFINYRLADLEISMLRSGRLGVDREAPLVKAISAFRVQLADRLLLNASGVAGKYEYKGFDAYSFPDLLEPAMRAEFGFTFNDFEVVINSLLDVCEIDQVAHVQREDMVHRVVVNSNIKHVVVEKVLDAISIKSRSKFLSIKEQAYPWRMNRDFSYLRRPIISRDGKLVYGRRALHSVLPFWINSLLSGRFQRRASAEEMKQLISYIRSGINESFVEHVSRILKDLDVINQTSVKKVGRKRLLDQSKQDIGDVDVLGVDKCSNTILAIEVKDFEVARTPAEISHEIEKLYRSSGKKKSALELHYRRVGWLCDNIVDVLHSFEIYDDDVNWKVEGLLVTSEPLLSGIMSDHEIPVIAIDDFSKFVLDLRSRR